MILATPKRERFTGQTSQTILRLCPSSVRPVTDLSPRARMGSHPTPRKIFPDFEAELGFSGIHCIMFSGSAFASAPLSTTANIFTIPFLLRSSATCSRIQSLSSSHIDPRTVPLFVGAPTSPGALLSISRFAGHHGPSSFPGGELIRQDSLPKYPSRSVSSSSSVEQPSSLVSSPSGASFTGAQPRGVSNPSAHVACEAFFLAFDLSSTSAFLLDFSMVLPATLSCCHGKRFPAAFYHCGVPCR